MGFIIKRRMTVCFILLGLLCCLTVISGSQIAHGAANRSFEFKWVAGLDEQADAAEAKSTLGWSVVTEQSPPPEKPARASGFWVRITLPKLEDGSGILFDGLSGQRFLLTSGSSVLYNFKAESLYPYHRILVPLHETDSGKTLYLYGRTVSGVLGIEHIPSIGPFDELSSIYMQSDLLNMTLGITFLFVAVVMLVCSVFLTREQRRNWLSLSLVVMTIGVMIVMYCPFPYLFYGEYERLYWVLFDGALDLCLPALAYFFEHMLGSGWKRIVRHSRVFLTYYSALCFAATIVNEWTNYRFFPIYQFVTGTIMGILIILLFILLAALCVSYAWKRNFEAIVICAGLAVLILSVAAEIAWFFREDGQYELFVWKWSLTGFVFLLIVLLSRRYLKEHEQAAAYARELELYNNQLQQSKQKEVVSHLAASVAHEVRNPLAVTRGFLQLLGQRTQQEGSSLQQALQELDRAQTVITNYLTFAKPDTDEIKLMSMNELLEEVLRILKPLLLLQRVSAEHRSEGNLFVRGSASWLKQALITIVKQRVQSLTEGSRIVLYGYEEDGKVIVQIFDAGIGRHDPPQLQPDDPLTDPFVDAGLIFAMRSIEAMGGKLQFMKGTTGEKVVVIRLPVVREPEEQDEDIVRRASD